MRRKARADPDVQKYHPFPGATRRFSEVEVTGHLPIALSARVEDGRPILSMLDSLVASMKLLYRVHIMVDSGAKLRSPLPMFRPGHLTPQRLRFAPILLRLC